METFDHKLHPLGYQWKANNSYETQQSNAILPPSK
jgi:hypothetical protein